MRLEMIAALGLALAASACSGKGDDTGASANDYCSGLSAASNPGVATILEIRWTTPGEDGAQIRWGKNGDLSNTFDGVVSDGGSHTATILGVPSISNIDFEIVHDSGEVCPGSVVTNNLPSTLPGMEITAYDGARMSPERYLAGAAMGGQTAYFVIDRETGDYLWYKELEIGTYTYPMMYFDISGNDIVYNVFYDDRTNTDNFHVRETLTGEEVWSYVTPFAHHAFTRLADGRIAYLVADVRTVQEEDTDDPDLVGLDVVGEAIWILDPDTGETSELFSTWDYAKVQVGPLWDNGFYPQGYTWTHGNAIEYTAASPTTGGETIMISLAGLDAIIEVALATGEVVAEFTGAHKLGTDAAWPVAEGDLDFSFQHDVNWTEAGTLIMSSTQDFGEGEVTYEVEYEVDEASQQLREIWSCSLDQGVNAFVLGQARRLDNGNTLISFGSAGLIRELTPDCEVVWELGAAAGNFFGQVFLLDDLYTGQ